MIDTFRHALPVPPFSCKSQACILHHMLVIWLSLSTDVMAKLLAVGVCVFCLWTQLAPLVQLAPAFVGWQNTHNTRRHRYRGACEASKIEVSVFSDLA